MDAVCNISKLQHRYRSDPGPPFRWPYSIITNHRCLRLLRTGLEPKSASNWRIPQLQHDRGSRTEQQNTGVITEEGPGYTVDPISLHDDHHRFVLLGARFAIIGNAYESVVRNISEAACPSVSEIASSIVGLIVRSSSLLGSNIVE